MKRGWTIGCELEIADSKRDTPLRGGSTWDRKDYTIVNSNGVANDPKGITWKFGGEVNTRPTPTVDDQLNVIDDVYQSCSPRPAVNYRSNLHIHIHVPGLAEDVRLVQRAIRYTQEQMPRVFELVDPLPEKPTTTLALERWKRRKRSHHTLLSEKQLTNIMAATSANQLRAAHAPLSKTGVPQFHLLQRAGVNFLALWDHPPQTIEFRHFCLSLSYLEIRHALQWCIDFLEQAIGDQEPAPLHYPYPWQPLIDERLEQRYIRTSPRYHPRELIIQIIDSWRKDGTL